jgi:hypothetical protein
MCARKGRASDMSAIGLCAGCLWHQGIEAQPKRAAAGIIGFNQEAAKGVYHDMCRTALAAQVWMRCSWRRGRRCPTAPPVPVAGNRRTRSRPPRSHYARKTCTDVWALWPCFVCAGRLLLACEVLQVYRQPHVGAVLGGCSGGRAFLLRISPVS